MIRPQTVTGIYKLFFSLKIVLLNGSILKPPAWIMWSREQDYLELKGVRCHINQVSGHINQISII